MHLIRPDAGWTKALGDYRDEFIARGETPYGSAGLKTAQSISDWLAERGRNSGAATADAGVLPSVTYLALEDGRFVCMLTIRLELDEYLLTYSGHIGYSVRPGERGRGYATRMLEQALDICRERGMERVLMTCDEDNPASERVIQRCGGVKENEVLDGSTMVRRYWIEL